MFTTIPGRISQATLAMVGQRAELGPEGFSPGGRSWTTESGNRTAVGVDFLGGLTGREGRNGVGGSEERSEAFRVPGCMPGRRYSGRHGSSPRNVLSNL